MHADWPALYTVSTTLIDKFPNEPSAYHHRCASLLRLGRFDQAIPACERALKISPRDTRVPIWHGLIGMNEYMRGRYEAAVDRARSSAIARLWPATEPSFVAGRDRIAARARELGLP